MVSNLWKLFFQCLEKSAGKIPRVGKRDLAEAQSAQRVSKGWKKRDEGVAFTLEKFQPLEKI